MWNADRKRICEAPRVEWLVKSGLASPHGRPRPIFNKQYANKKHRYEAYFRDIILAGGSTQHVKTWPQPKDISGDVPAEPDSAQCQLQLHHG